MGYLRPSSAWLLDTAIALGALAIGTAELTGAIPGSNFPGPLVANAVFVVFTAAPLVIRRAFPMTAFLLVVVVTTTWQYSLFSVEVQMPFEPFVALLIVVFGAGAYTRDRVAAAALATVGVGTVLSVVDLLAGEPLGSAVPPMLMILGVFVLGRLVAGYRERAHEFAVRAVRAEREAEDVRRLAVAEERARIARELHDVISHDVSLMVLQASVERRIRSQADADDSDDTAAILASIEATGRDALAELRRMLGVLRSVDPDAPLTPQPGLAELGELIDQARSAGLDVRVERDTDGLALPSGLDLTAYRLVQESLTNVAKHVGPTRVSLALRRRPDELEIEVVNDGPARSLGLEGGHGLIGMRERVALYGGTLVTGPHEQGFRVCARLPVVEPS